MNPQIELNNGVLMPRVGFGVYQIEDLAECQRSVETALEVGYRSIDTATLYKNESAVGAAIKASAVAREDLFITTKVWHSQTSYEGVMRSFEYSMEKLGLDYLDLYLIHQPFHDIFGAWRAMEELYAKGLIRAIGVSNFFPARLADILAYGDVVPAVNQVEAHVLHQQREAQAFMAEHGIRMEAWAPLARGVDDVFQHPVLLEIAKSHAKSVPQVILRWLMQRDVIIIPKSSKPERIRENFELFDFELTEDEMARIAELDRGQPAFGDHTELATAQRLLGRHVEI
ncbi:MAG: aldo/keto reductase [Corynebacterium sp.]|nr:aldo/keto reductase [Corynebacterium sp.]